MTPLKWIGWVTLINSLESNRLCISNIIQEKAPTSRQCRRQANERANETTHANYFIRHGYQNKISYSTEKTVLKTTSKSENQDQHNIAKLYRRATSPTQQICPHAKNVHKQTFPFANTCLSVTPAHLAHARSFITTKIHRPDRATLSGMFHTNTISMNVTPSQPQTAQLTFQSTVYVRPSSLCRDRALQVFLSVVKNTHKHPHRRHQRTAARKPYTRSISVASYTRAIREPLL